MKQTTVEQPTTTQTAEESEKLPVEYDSLMTTEANTPENQAAKLWSLIIQGENRAVATSFPTLTMMEDDYYFDSP